MQNILKKEIKILSSMCDNTGKLSLPYTFVLFTDLASEHAPMLKLGADDLAEKGVFWVTTKTLIKFHRRPKMQDIITASTWPQAPGRIRCNRFYTLSDERGVMIEGKSEWAMIDIDGRPHKISEVYTEGITHLEDTVCDEPFARINDDFSDAEIIDTYKIKSTDIDIAQHMNNAMYLKVLFGAFSCKEREEMTVNEIQIAFKNQSFEGDVLTVKRRKGENGTEFALVREDGATSATVIIK